MSTEAALQAVMRRPITITLSPTMSAAVRLNSMACGQAPEHYVFDAVKSLVETDLPYRSSLTDAVEAEEWSEDKRPRKGVKRE